MRKIILVVVVLLAWPAGSYLPSVRAADQNETTGTWLLRACELSLKATDNHSHLNGFDADRDGYCRGFTRGIGAASPFVCLPGEVTGEQEIRVVTKYLEDHPKELTSHLIYACGTCSFSPQGTVKGQSLDLHNLADFAV